jgi:hypothetical protein
MVREFVPPLESEIEGVQPPMVYIHEDLTWEYKRIRRDLDEQQILDEEELNALGAEGWELVTSVRVGSTVSFYFRRPKK